MAKETSKVTLIILVTLVSFFILMPILVSAAGLVPCGGSGEPECDLCYFLLMIKNVMDLILKLGGVICFLIVVTGGVLLLVAGGSENLIGLGKKIFTSAIIGLVIILSSWLIISAIFGATGYNAADNWYEFECEMPSPPPPPSPTHLACQDGYCKEVEGEGDDTCHSNDECGHFECRNEKCERIEGEGDNKCSSDIECQPIWSCGGGPSGQRMSEASNCLSKPKCKQACDIYEGQPLAPYCFNDTEFCEAVGLRVYECLQTDNCSKLGLEDYADSFCGGPCPPSSICCSGTQEEIDRAKCQLQCYPAGYDYNPQTGECACITDTYLKCEKESIQGFPGYFTYYCREVAGTETNECANEGEECVPPEGTLCPSGQDRECPLGQICENNVCVNGCREDPDCPAGQICENGSCVEKCRDCKPGEKYPCYKRHDRCPGGICTEFKCCSNCVCKCGNWFECALLDDYCYSSEAAQCSDGNDNDGDGYADEDDRACHEENDINKPYHSEYNDESAAKTTQCSDGKDNDGDGKTDYLQDPECTSLDDNDESNGEEEKTCDEQCGFLCGPPECHGYTGLAGAQCHFENGTWKDHCWECTGGNHPVSSCSDYLSKESCEADICNIDGCSWEGGSCVGAVVDPFEGYTLQVNEKQKDHASQALMDLLVCMKDKLPEEEARIISSISDDGILSDPVRCDYLKCSGNICGECSGCAHVCNSCHYGGRNCNTQERFSYAVDFAKEEYCDQIKTAALECNADVFVNYEHFEKEPWRDHVHVSLNKPSGCDCNEAAVGKPCPTTELTVLITSPADGSQFKLGENISFNSSVSGDGSPYAYSWNSSIDGNIGNSKAFTKNDLSFGDHKITLTVTDDAGKTATTSVNIHIVGDTFDWRNKDGYNWMTPVEHQGGCGSCWAHAATAVVEAKYNIQNNNPNLDIELSSQYLVSDCYALGDCDGGPGSGLEFSFIKNEGIIDEACCPFLGENSTCLTCSDRRLWRITDYYAIFSSSRKERKSKLIDKGPLYTQIDIEKWDPGTYTCAEGGEANHAVVIVGYDDTEGVWIVRNSWGADWEDGGYFKVAYGKCFIEDYLAIFVDKVIAP